MKGSGMESIGKYQVVHPDGTKLSPVDMATLAEMVYAGIVQADTPLFAVSTQRVISAGEIPYLAFLMTRLKDSPLAPMPRAAVMPPPRPLPPPSPLPTPPSPDPTPHSPLPQEALMPEALAGLPEPIAPPERKLSVPALPRLSPQVRAYMAFGVVALGLLVGLGFWQSHRSDRARTELLGDWQQLDGSRLVLKADGMGALTRPDTTYGNRTYLFRWERQSDQVVLTEQRILLPGGTRQTAADAREPISLSPDGQALHWGTLALRKAP